ncbi:MAG: DNA-protecting protein DprA [Lachnospiraceae bacterium]|nr:DNA-protecting protein DprA [Lachnospiraceae bacterium]
MMEMEHIHYVYWLSCLRGIGKVKRNSLLGLMGSEEEIFNASEEILSRAEGITAKDIFSILHERDKVKILEDYSIMESKGIKFTYKGHYTYPGRLSNIYNAPYSLFYKGELPDNNKKCVAVVGARNASYQGSVTASKIGRQLAENGIQVVSGLARGVDICAQRGTLQIAGGRTFAVMGCGVDICYPKQNIEEYMLIQRSGGIISEYPPGMPPLAGNFPMRNRIISGLSDGILVIEAGERSGSLITAEIGTEQGKDIFAIPGDIGNKLYYGSNELIKNGAALVTDIRDIMDALGMFYDCSTEDRKKKVDVVLERTEKIVYASLSLEPAHISEIALKTGLGIQHTMEILTGLELKRVVVMAGNNYFALRI